MTSTLEMTSANDDDNDDNSDSVPLLPPKNPINTIQIQNDDSSKMKIG